MIKVKEMIKRLIKDEGGIAISSEVLIFLVGAALVSSIVIGAITTILTGKDRDGSGGVTGNVTNQINDIMDNMVSD